MIELLEIVLSPHMVWASVLVFFAFRFKTSFSKLLEAITDRIKNVQGYKKTKDGHEVIFRDLPQSEKDNLFPNSNDSTPNVQPESVGLSVWPEDNTQDISALRQFVKTERASRYLWEYSYLNFFLARHTQLVLDWLISRDVPTTHQEFEEFWQQLIPEEKERSAVLGALSAHFLIVRTGSGPITTTPKGAEYHQWRGPLPKLVK